MNTSIIMNETLYFSFTTMSRESFGEDIADSETQRSINSEDEEYDDSFIDDGDPEVFPSTPLSDATGRNKKICAFLNHTQIGVQDFKLKLMTAALHHSTYLYCRVYVIVQITWNKWCI